MLIPFADKYATALDEHRGGQEAGLEDAMPSCPTPTDLKELAKREGLNYEITPMLSREQAERYGQISGAEVGLTRLSGGRKFADEFFDPKTGLYEPEELTDLLGTRYLARKIKDMPPHVPSARRGPLRRSASPGRWTRPAPWPRRPPRSWPNSSRRRAARSRTPRSRDIGS